MDCWSDDDETCPALVAPEIEDRVLEPGTKHGETKAEMRSPPGLSSLAMPRSLTVPSCARGATRRRVSGRGGVRVGWRKGGVLGW
eukprot:412416-Prymnesium_polylepis.1